MIGLSQYRGMYFTVLIVATIAMASYLGLLRHGQGWMYDHFVNILPHIFPEHNQVVIVELATHEPSPDEADWILLLETLQSLALRKHHRVDQRVYCHPLPNSAHKPVL